MPRRTYYDVLGVDSSAEQAVIRKAYLKASLKHHPDKNPDDIEGAKARFVECGQAYEILSDPVKRAEYDRSLRTGRTAGYRSTSSARDDFASGFGGGYSSNNYGGSAYQSPGYSEPSRPSADEFENYRDFFDANVAGMSEAEFAAAVGAVTAIASVVGSMVGSRLASRGGGASGGTSAASGVLSTVGSMAGSMVASQLAGNAVTAIHRTSVQRVAYREECKRAIARGEPIPEPPPKAQWERTLEDTVDSVKRSLFDPDRRSSNGADNSNRYSSDPSSVNRNYPNSANGNNGTSQRNGHGFGKWTERFQDTVRSAQAQAATAAAAGLAENLWQKAREGMQNPNGNHNTSRR